MTKVLSKTLVLYDAIQIFGRLLGHWMADNKFRLEYDGEHVWVCNAAFNGFQVQRDAFSHATVSISIDFVKSAATLVGFPIP